MKFLRKPSDFPVTPWGFPVTKPRWNPQGAITAPRKSTALEVSWPRTAPGVSWSHAVLQGFHNPNGLPEDRIQLYLKKVRKSLEHVSFFGDSFWIHKISIVFENYELTDNVTG